MSKLRNIKKYPSEIIDMYNNLRKLIFDSTSSEPDETLWAKLPSYYVGEAFVRLIPSKTISTLKHRRLHSIRRN